MRNVLLLCVLATGVFGQMRVGVAKRVITPDLKTHGPVYLAGFGQNRIATRVHDELYTRCMALAASARPLVICGVDSIGLFFDDVQKIRAKVSDADVVVAAMHNHETPDTMGLWGPAVGKTGINEAYNQRVVDLTTEAASEAVRSMKPARIRLGKIQSTELDALYDDSRPPVRHDSELTVLIAETTSGVPIGVLMDLSPFLRQEVKTQNPSNGELSHGIVSQAVH
jgi:hypothetical protein